MNRRDFIQQGCLTGLGVAAAWTALDSLEIPILKAATRKTATGMHEIPLMLVDTPELQTVGGAYHLEVEDLGANILVVRTAEDKFVAVDIKCPHKGCEVGFDAKHADRFICPCHGSEFTMEGKVTKGPAKTNLGFYQTTFKNGEVSIKLPEDTGGDSLMPTDTPKVDSTAIDSTKKQ